MVSRALSTQSNSTTPSCTSASAECSSCVRPRKARNCSAAAARLAGLLKRLAPRVSVWSAPSTSRPGTAPATALALARASKRAVAAASMVPALASTARSSICAGLISKRRPTAASILPRTSLFDASTSGCGLSQSAMTTSLSLPLRGGISGYRLTTAFAQQLHNRGGGFLDRTARHVDDGPAVFGAEPARKRHLLGHRGLVDIAIVVAMRFQAQQPVLADLHDALGTGIEPDHQRPRQLFHRGRQRYARHQRHIAGFDAAIGEIDRGRRFRRARDADQHNVGFLQPFDVLAVVVKHRVV